MTKYVISVFLILSLLGCAKDARAKRAASLLNLKTQLAAEDLSKATTDADKARVSSEYFQTAPALTQAIEDYLFGREPKNIVVPARAQKQFKQMPVKYDYEH